MDKHTTIEKYTNYTVSAYSEMDSSLGGVWIYGQLVMYNLSLRYSSAYTPTSLQNFVYHMPTPLYPRINITIAFNTSSTGYVSGRHRIYNEYDGEYDGILTNWYHNVSLPANNPMVLSGVYIKKY